MLALRFIFWLHVIPAVGLFLQAYFFTLILITQPPRTYLKEVVGPEKEVKTINETLNIFNSFTDINIIKRKGSRPITIKVIDDFVENKFLVNKTLGSAVVRWDNCDIRISRNRLKNSKDFMDTILHEYLHCFGYEHVDKPDDLMYKYLNYVSPTSMKKYAEDLGERLK